MYLFLYATKGEIIKHIDARDEKNLSRILANFHNASTVKEILTKPSVTTKTITELYIPNPRLSYYQTEATEAVENVILDKKRTILLAMVTRTGKTFTHVSQIYRLLDSELFKRILFLVDRRALLPWL